LGLHQIDGGKMHFNNQAFSDMDEEERRTLRREMGMVFQGSALFDSMSVLENVMFPMQMLTKKSESEIKRAAEEVIARVNLENANEQTSSRAFRRHAKTRCHRARSCHEAKIPFL
jgi:phospholipid/cholesterol/gamma-HCH transport system ATP-binding protein